MHRREAVMQAVLAAVTGLATTGANAFRGRVYAVPEGKLPATLVRQGEEEKVEDYSQDLADWDLQVHVGAVVRADSDDLETNLNAIASEQVVALEADYTLGGAAIEIEELGSQEPELSGEGEKPTAVLWTNWRVRYRRSRTNPET